MLDPTVLYATLALLGVIVAVQGALSVRAKNTHNKKMRTFAIAGVEAMSALIVSASKERRRAIGKTIATTVDKIVDEIVALELANDKSLAELLGKTARGYRTAAGAAALAANPLDDILFGGSPFRTREGTPTSQRAGRLPSLEEMLAAIGNLPRYTGRFKPYAFAPLNPRDFGIDPTTFGHDTDEQVAKDAGSADPLADPVERTTGDGRIAGDGGTVSEAEANAETQAEPVGEYGAAYKPPEHAGNEHARDFDSVEHGSNESFAPGNHNRRVPRYAKTV